MFGGPGRGRAYRPLIQRRGPLHGLKSTRGNRAQGIVFLPTPRFRINRFHDWFGQIQLSSCPSINLSWHSFSFWPLCSSSKGHLHVCQLWHIIMMARLELQ